MDVCQDIIKIRQGPKVIYFEKWDLKKALRQILTLITSVEGRCDLMKEVCQEKTEGDHVLGLRAEHDRLGALPEVLPDGRGKPAVSDSGDFVTVP